jgi:hypothetical protein
MAVTATITQADNQILLFLNGLLIYSRYTDFDPTFNETVDFTARLKGSGDYLTMVGLNWGGPYDFAVTVNNNGTSTTYGTSGQQQPPPAFGVAWTDTVQID